MKIIIKRGGIMNFIATCECKGCGILYKFQEEAPLDKFTCPVCGKVNKVPEALDEYATKEEATESIDPEEVEIPEQASF